MEWFSSEFGFAIESAVAGIIASLACGLGAFPLFIRGIDETGDSRCGIYFDFPNPDLIDVMGRTLIPGYN